MESESDNVGSGSLRVASFSCYLDPAKDNLIRRISSQDQSPLVIKSPISVKPPQFHANFPHLKESLIKNGRTEAFSYLSSGAGENFVCKVPGATKIQDPPSAFTFSQDHSKDSEISVFGADRYFNMKLEYTTGSKRECKKDGQIEILPQVSSDIRPGLMTRSLCSDQTTSWTSQTAMLKKLQRQDSHTRRKKCTGWRIFAGFGGCPVPCFDNKNNKTAEETRGNSKGSSSQRIKHPATIPNLQAAQNLTVRQQLVQVEDEKLEEEGRKSLEVFGSSASSRRDIATNLERKLSMLTWDAIPSGKNSNDQLPASAIESSTICDDMASDASSDLFEIENISGCINQILTSTKVEHEHDDVSCMSPTSHYAPSEASIQWSVVTGSAADYASYLSDNEERICSVAGDLVSKNNATKMGSGNYRTAGGGKEGQKIRQGGLLGCKTQKSVDVAETVCHLNLEKVKH